MNGPTGHLVGSFVLNGNGADFSSTNSFNLFASDDEWTAPIMAEVGPDGQVWVIDWYNYIVQHNPTPKGFETGKGAAYETKLRDKKHGRIYRVVVDGWQNKPARNLAIATPAELVDALNDPTMLVRKHAQRLLVERGDADVESALIALVNNPSTDAIGLNTSAIHALWTLHGLGLLDGNHPDSTAASVAALEHSSAGVRRNALQVLPPTSESSEALVSADLHHDEDAQVRLAAILALADLPTTDASAHAVMEMVADALHLRTAGLPTPRRLRLLTTATDFWSRSRMRASYRREDWKSFPWRRTTTPAATTHRPPPRCWRVCPTPIRQQLMSSSRGSTKVGSQANRSR